MRSRIFETLNKDAIYQILINNKTNKHEDDLGKLGLANHKFNKESKNVVTVTFQIYDLQNTEIIFLIKYFGLYQIAESYKSDINFMKFFNQILTGLVCYF